ncbi:hypothetical protein LCGC14_0799390 [marine sediment metagenome]|uniref:Uncharacterized protein n=1 Tax=marine sediment metagenome TaxID=412755 RepID=A0A0F9PUK8_9ZZZZ
MRREGKSRLVLNRLTGRVEGRWIGQPSRRLYLEDNFLDTPNAMAVYRSSRRKRYGRSKRQQRRGNMGILIRDQQARGEVYNG